MVLGTIPTMHSQVEHDAYGSLHLHCIAGIFLLFFSTLLLWTFVSPRLSLDLLFEALQLKLHDLLLLLELSG